MSEDKIITDWEWNTHQPLLKMLIEVIGPKLIVELGTGIFSSPIFFKSNAEKLFFIDNDEKWLEKIQKENISDSRCIFRFHNLGDKIIISTPVSDLKEVEFKKIQTYYVNFSKEIDLERHAPKLLFVDHFRCARALAINSMFNSFDVIAYHDSQSPNGTLHYQYFFDKEIYKKFNLFCLKTSTSWTHVFIRKTFHSLEKELFQKIQPHINNYIKENNLPEQSVYLVKDNPVNTPGNTAPGRNEKCPCNQFGKKYKDCCGKLS